MSNISHISHISTQNGWDYTVKWVGLKCRDARLVRPLKGELKANRAIVGTDARAVRPYMRMNNQLVDLFTWQLPTEAGTDHEPCVPTCVCIVRHLNYLAHQFGHDMYVGTHGSCVRARGVESKSRDCWGGRTSRASLHAHGQSTC